MSYVKLTQQPNADMVIEAQTLIEAVPEYDLPEVRIYFKGFLPGYDEDNDTLSTGADAGDLIIDLIVGDTVRHFALDENGAWSEVV